MLDADKFAPISVKIGPRGAGTKCTRFKSRSSKRRDGVCTVKVFEILCKRGRVIVSGSANGTGAALNRSGNIEACVVRILRTAATGWKFRPSEPPELQAALADEQGIEERSVGVLRAVLDADELAGEVLVPKMSGCVSVSYVTGLGAEPLGKTDVSAEGAFRIAAPALEERSWLGGRLVARVKDQHGRLAEGFVSIASFADITRRAGAIGRRLFAVLAGTETPEDVAAIISWFYEDPQRLADTLPRVSGPQWLGWPDHHPRLPGGSRGVASMRKPEPTIRLVPSCLSFCNRIRRTQKRRGKWITCYCPGSSIIKMRSTARSWSVCLMPLGQRISKSLMR